MSRHSGVERISGLTALLLPVSTPALIVSAVGFTEGGSALSVVLMVLAFGTVWLARPPVNRYRASLATPPRAWEGLSQFTPAYFRFHARRASIPWWSAWCVFVVLAALVVVGWFALWIWAVVDPTE